LEATGPVQHPVTSADPQGGQPQGDDGTVLLAQVLSNGLRKGTSPEDMSFILDDLMDDNQIEMLTNLGHESLLNLAKANGVDKRVPDLNHPDMPAYLEQVIRALEME
jgi:hypothetical protein